MALQRFLCAPLRCYSPQLRLLNPHRNVVQNVSAQSSSYKPAPDALLSQLLCLVKRQGAGRGLCTGPASHLSRDVTLFDHDRTRFFRLLCVFCGGQFLFWTYLAQFAYTGLRDTRGTKDWAKTEETKTTGLAGMWSFEMNLGSSAWRFGFTAGCLAIGAGIVGLGFLFCRRSVNRIILHQGGKIVTVYTQSPLGPGRGRKITVPLSQVACYAHRQESSSFIPLRVKGHKFYFLMDKEGTVTNAKLFDVTVGAYRVI